MLKKLNIGENRFIYTAFFISFVFGFIMSTSNIAGVASFTDISVSGALGFPSSTVMLTGCLVKSLIDGNVGRNAVKISSMVMIVISKMFYDGKKPEICGIITGSAVLISGISVSVLIGEMWYKMPFYIFYGLISGYATYSVSVIYMGLKKQMIIDLSGNSGCAYAIVYTLFTASFCSLKIPFINAGIIMGTAITLFSAYYYRYSGGVLCGALTVCGAFLASSEIGMSIVLLPVSALIIGYLYKIRYSTVSVIFMVSCFLLLVLTGTTKNSINYMVNTIIGTVIFCIFAPHYSDKWIKTTENTVRALPDIANARLEFLSDSISAVRNDAEKISERLGRPQENYHGFNVRKICESCEKKSECNCTAEISAELFPFEVSECIHCEDINSELIKLNNSRIIDRLSDMKTSQFRTVLYEQIRNSEEIIKSCGKKCETRFSEPISKLVNEKLLRYGFSPDNVIAYYNEYNRLIAEIYFSGTNQPDNFTRICDLVADEINIPLELTAIGSKERTRLRLSESTEYFLNVFGASVCAGNSDENGDTFNVFYDGIGNGYAVLSDGMGSGKNAAVESRIVIRMFRQLVCGGVDIKSAIRLINSVMITKSKDESFATLDAVIVNLDRCEMNIIKSGASATIIRHKRNVMKVTSTSLPVGLMEKTEIFSGSYPIEEGDIIIMFSDGISENEYLFIKELLLGGDDLKKIVSDICSKADVFNSVAGQDDVTVIGIKIMNRKHKQVY